MADDPILSNLEQPAEQTPTGEPAPGMDEHGRDLEAMRLAAEKVFAERAEEDGRPAPARKRDSQGRFIPAESGTAEQQPPAPPFDPVWNEVARAEGLTDADLAAAKSEQEIQNRIALARIQKMQSLGIDPVELAHFRQWRDQAAGGGTPATPAQQPAAQPQPTTLEDLQLAFNEDEITPEVVGPLKAVTEYANKVKATYGAELQKVQQELAALKSQLQQSAEEQSAARKAQAAAEQFDSMAAKVQGFAEHFGGKPSELAALAAATNMRDPKVRRLMAWDIEHFQPALEKYEGILGEGNPRARELALQAAWKSAGLDKRPASNGKSNGTTTTFGPGSVVVSQPRRPATESIGNSLEDQYQASLNSVRSAWDTAGGNPFRMS